MATQQEQVSGCPAITPGENPKGTTMTIGVSGKGGSGKTTVAGTLARLLARGGHRVLAIDADPAPNLAITLGIPREQVPALGCIPPDLLERTSTLEGGTTLKLRQSTGEIVNEYAVQAPDDVTLLLMATVDHAGTG